MLLCRGGRIYTGATTDVAARFARHRAGKGAAFTRSFPPSRILGACPCASRGEALSLEHALKQAPPAAKRRWARRWPWPYHRPAMADVINLRQARKRKARAGKDAQAAANRAKFGRTPAQRARDAAEADEARRKLDRLKLDPPAED